MTLKQILDIAKNKIEDTVFWTDAKLTEMANDALRSIYDLFNITQVKSYEDLATVASQKRYDTPVDYLATHMMQYDSGGNHIITMVDDPRIIYSLVNNVDTEGKPTHAYIWGIEDRNEIWLYPVPDAVYTIHWFFYAMPALLVNDDDQPMIPLNHHQALAEYLVMRTKADDINTMQAELTFDAWWNGKLSKMKISNAAMANVGRDMQPGNARALFGKGAHSGNISLRLSSSTYRW